MYSNNRMIWMITGYVPGTFSSIKGRFICIAGVRIITLIDPETGDFFGRSINCPPGCGEKQLQFLSIWVSEYLNIITVPINQPTWRASNASGNSARFI